MLWLLLFVALALAATVGFAAGPRKAAVGREVLAFYYGWWGTPPISGSWVHWADVDPSMRTIGNTAHYPATGAYDSHDPAVIDRQMSQMRAAGLTGLISSWWGRGGFDDHSLDLIMRAAPRHHLKVSVYYETAPTASLDRPQPERVDAVLADMAYLLDGHVREPNWLKIGDHPVIFVFRRAIDQLGLQGWWIVNQQLKRRSPAPVLIADVPLDSPTGPVLAAFGGVHAYNNSDQTARKSPEELRAWAGQAFPRWISRWRGAVTCLTIMPGFGNAKAGSSPIAHSITDRFAGATYRVLGEEAIRARPDWLLVTSWNEWHEGSEIEPSFEDGSRALEQTSAIVARFRPASGQGSVARR